MRRRSGTYPSLQLFAAVPAVYVLRLDLMSAAGANQMDDGFSLQIPESGLELIDLPHFFQQQLGIRRSAGVGGINELDGTYEQSAQATMVGAMDYVEHLRNSEAYDNTVLIVMSDHGYNGSLGQSGEATWMRQCALLLIKGRNEHHDTMQISQAPISFEDLQEAYVRLLDGRRSDEVFDWKEGDARERRFLRYSFLDDDHMQEYIQTGYASDMDTMIPTGREYNR